MRNISEKHQILMNNMNLLKNNVNLTANNDYFTINYIAKNNDLLLYLKNQYDHGDIILNPCSLGYELSLCINNIYKEIGILHKKEYCYEIIINHKVYQFFHLFYLNQNKVSTHSFSNSTGLDSCYIDNYRVHVNSDFICLRYMSRRNKILEKDTVSINDVFTYRVHCLMETDAQLIPINFVKLPIEVTSIMDHFHTTINKLIDFTSDKKITASKIIQIEAVTDNILEIIVNHNDSTHINLITHYKLFIKGTKTLYKILSFIKDNFSLFDYPIFESFFGALDPHLRKRLGDAYCGDIKTFSSVEWYISLIEIQEI